MQRKGMMYEYFLRRTARTPPPSACCLMLVLALRLFFSLMKKDRTYFSSPHSLLVGKSQEDPPCGSQDSTRLVPSTITVTITDDTTTCCGAFCVWNMEHATVPGVRGCHNKKKVKPSRKTPRYLYPRDPGSCGDPWIYLIPPHSAAFPPGASCLLPCLAALRAPGEHPVLAPLTKAGPYTPVGSSMVWQQSGKGYRSPLMATAVVAVVAGLVVATTMATGNVVVAEMVVGGGSGGGSGSGRDVGGGGGGGGDAGGRKHERKQKIRAAWAGSSRADTAFPLSHLHFCLGCPDPGAEGSLGEFTINRKRFISASVSKYAVKSYSPVRIPYVHTALLVLYRIMTPLLQHSCAVMSGDRLKILRSVDSCQPNIAPEQEVELAVTWGCLHAPRFTLNHFTYVYI